MYESFIRGEEEEGDEAEGDARPAVLEEAWAAARPSRNNEPHVTVVAAIIIIMVIILTQLNAEPRPSQPKYYSQQLICCGVFFVSIYFWTPLWQRPNALSSTRPPDLDSSSDCPTELLSLRQNPRTIFLFDVCFSQKFCWLARRSSSEGRPRSRLISAKSQKGHTGALKPESRNRER